MGLLDTISKIGFGIEDAFTPANERYQNQLLREQLLLSKYAREQDMKRKEALKLLTTPSPIQGTPNTEKAALGGASLPALQPGPLPLLAQAFPEQVGQALVSQFFPQDKQGRLNFAQKGKQLEGIIGRPLNEDEWLKLAGLAKDGEDLDTLVKRADLAKTLAELDKLKGELGDKVVEQKKAAAEKKTTLETTLDSVVKTIGFNENLRGTFAQTGNVGIETRGELLIPLLAELTQDPKYQSLQSDYNSFRKFASEGVIRAIDKLKGAGTVQTAKLEVLAKSLANLEADPDTNNRVLTDFIKELLRVADVNGINIENRDQYESILKEVSGNPARDLLEKLRKRNATNR